MDCSGRIRSTDITIATPQPCRDSDIELVEQLATSTKVATWFTNRPCKEHNTLIIRNSTGVIGFGGRGWSPDIRTFWRTSGDPTHTGDNDNVRSQDSGRTKLKSVTSSVFLQIRSSVKSIPPRLSADFHQGQYSRRVPTQLLYHQMQEALVVAPLVLWRDGLQVHISTAHFVQSHHAPHDPWTKTKSAGRHSCWIL